MKYKLDHVIIDGNMQYKLLYTIIEQNERLIELLSPCSEEPKKVLSCEVCGMTFDKPIQKASHVKKCRGANKDERDNPE